MSIHDDMTIKSMIYEDLKAEEKARLYDEAVSMDQARQDDGGNRHGPNWQTIAQVASALFLGLGAYFLKGIMAQSEDNGRQILALKTQFEEKVIAGERDHARFDATDKEILTAIKLLNEKLQAEREARIRGER